MKTSLIIMAAGLGSRFAGGIKQLSPVGAGGEIIMDYSIHDAISAGFDKIIIVIRKDIEDDFKEVIGSRIEPVCKSKKIELRYVFQELSDIPAEVPEGRKKPWGTGHAVLSAKEEIKGSFAVINADDYYGREAFRKIHNYICNELSENKCCMAGFVLRNTLSPNGGVTRGISKTDNENNLLDITETPNVIMCGDRVLADGKEINPDSTVSMNMWGFEMSFIEKLEKGFADFFDSAVRKNPLYSEYLLPVFIKKLLSEKEIAVKVIPTADKWYGVTYKTDIESARDFFDLLIKKGLYKKELYSDL